MGILQARILEWVAMTSSRGSSQPRDWTQDSRIAGRFFTVWATREAQVNCTSIKYIKRKKRDGEEEGEQAFALLSCKQQAVSPTGGTWSEGKPCPSFFPGKLLSLAPPSFWENTYSSGITWAGHCIEVKSVDCRARFIPDSAVWCWQVTRLLCSLILTEACLSCIRELNELIYVRDPVHWCLGYRKWGRSVFWYRHQY